MNRTGNKPGRGHLRRGPRSWAAIHFADEAVEYAVAREADGRLDVVHESSAATVSRLRQQINPRDHRIVTGLPCEEVLCRALYLPTTNEAELHQMLALQIDQLTPVPLDEVVYDFEPLEEADGQTLVLVAIARKSVVNERVARLEECGLPPELVSIDALSLYRSFLQGDVIERDDRLNALVLLRGAVVHILVYAGGWPLLVRSVYWSSQTGDLATTLSHELRCTQLSAQAEWPGRDLGTVRVAAVDAGLEPQARQVAEQWGTAGLVIADGAVPSPARCLCPLTVRERRFNLLPDEWRQRRRAARMKRLAVRWLAVAGVVYLLGFTAFALVRQLRKAQVDTLQAQIGGLEPEYRASRQLHSELVAMQKQLDTKYSSLDVLREISMLMSANIKLDTFSFRRDETVVLKGQANSAEAVYDLISRIEQCELFSEVKTPGVKTQGSLTKFELVATLRSAAGREGGGVPFI
jgi:type II secretory pathway component PulL